MPAAPPSAIPAPPPSGASVAEWRAAIAALPIDVRECLAPLFQPGALRTARNAERDALLKEMAAGRAGGAKTQAQAVRDELMRYAASAWRFDRDRDAPHDQRHMLAHRILKLDGGEVLSVRSLREIIAVSAVAEKTAGKCHAAARKG